MASKLAGVPQPAREAALLAATLAGAVQAAHVDRIVHRDLKPANILLTSDGTPKIVDFSLARSFAGDSSLTLSSARVGTPSYMAPEQAMGKAEAFCPSVDIYALGAVLYESLTGRPPFRAETPLETQRQVISEDPAPPSRLNARVPRDLETICLKCLQKDPQRRYPTAAAMGDDLHRFLRGEPIAARPAGLAERVVKWIRRRPAQATAFAAVTLVLLTLVGAGVLLASQQATTAHAITQDLHEVERHQDSSDWIKARTALERAKARLSKRGNESLRARVAQSELNLDLVARLDKIRLIRSAVVDGRISKRANNLAADREYAATFDEAGLVNGDQDDPAAIAARLKASSIREALIAALDDWAACNTGFKQQQRQQWLLQIATLADHDPTGWRRRARDPAAWNDPSVLAELSRTVPDSERSLSLLLWFGEKLGSQRPDGFAFLRKVQEAHPDDFWANTTLGLAIAPDDPTEAIRFFQAALAIRPDAAMAHANVGVSLGAIGRLDEATTRLREAVRLDPSLALAHNGLGNTLLLKGLHQDAIAHYQRAIELEPNSSSAHNNMGKALVETGRMELGREHFEKALEIDPEYASAHSSLGMILHKQGQADEAIKECERALQLDPDLVAGHINLSLSLRTRGRLDEAIEHLRLALRLAPRDAEVRHYLAVALKDAGHPIDAAEQYREALRLVPAHAKSHHGLGIIVGESGDLEGAIAHFRRALEVDPTHVISHGAIGRALMAQGRFAEARPEFQRYLDAASHDEQVRKIMSGFIRQCDSLIMLEGRLEAVQRGKDKPADDAEYLQFAELCKFKKQYALSAVFFADGFDKYPSLAGNLQARHRYEAACVAALAGAVANEGPAVDTQADQAQRSRWRERSRQWLQDDLDAWAAMLEKNDPSLRRHVRKVLTNWRSDAELSAIRDPMALALLPLIERYQCEAFWKDVDALIEQTKSSK
ncbi:MAG: tetratricopeptide repeat protein [Pyrinomonadaceae bacterium]|nr:tetratricopeptide repeat protein [Phycisphaerales bacterium]